MTCLLSFIEGIKHMPSISPRSVISSKGYGYGWKADSPSQKDNKFAYAANPATLASLPPLVDLRPHCPPVYDQGQLGSCTANAIAGAIEFDQIKQNISEATPSRLFVYWNERYMEGGLPNTKQDSGAMIRDGVKSVNKQGACAEALFPYDITKFKQKPSAACYKAALTHKISSYHRVSRSLLQLKGCLAEGFPIIIGFTVYESFESQQVADTGIMPIPEDGEQELGGHAVLVVGFRDSDQAFITRNSWSDGWGDKGHFYMPYQYLLRSDLSSDFWTIRSTQ
jgi:C1A family cysteine protease